MVVDHFCGEKKSPETRAGPNLARFVMGQTNCRDSWDIPPSSSPRIISRMVCKNPGYMQYSQNNSKNIQDLLEWVRNEFDPHQYSGRILNPKALGKEIEKKCSDKLNEEWAKFGSYPKENEKTYRLCMFASMVDEAKENLKSKKTNKI
jgi:hypothetical protein